MSDLAQDTLQNQSLLAAQAALVAQLPGEKQAHFMHLLDVLLACYIQEDAKALLLVSEGQGEKERIQLVAVNADPRETEELIDTLCVFRKLDFQEEVPLMN